ncbi:MAG: BtpA/SgcQ family protein [Oceanipulchritudo sp.]
MNRPARQSFPDKSLLAMVGLKPLPGAPLYGGSEQAVVDAAMADVEAYSRAGVDAILVENSGDLPYMKPPLEEAAGLLVEQICAMIRSRWKGPLGLQLLEAANEQALRIAANCAMDYIRVEGFVFAHVGGAGLIEGCAGRLLRLRRRLGAESIRVFADVRKKHCAHALTGDLPLSEHVRQADFFRADGIVVTGPRTGTEPETTDLLASRQACDLPLLIGSGMNAGNLERFFPEADGFIVGSDFREEGAFLGKLSAARLESFMSVFRRLKNGERIG